MPVVCLCAALLCLVPLCAQTPRPTFRADRVIPSFGDTPLMLAPGMLVSIYGSYLGPAVGCQGYGDQQRVETLPADNPFGIWERMAIYPQRLCEVQVMIGDLAAGLTWVQADQINFQVPKNVPFNASAPLRVIYEGAASDAVPLRFGLERMTITQDEPAYAGTAVWVRVHTANDLQAPLQFPFRRDPLRLACENVEVRRNGMPLPRTEAKTSMGWGGGGSFCGHISLPGKAANPGRLPLHLFYRFDQPGSYEVRFTLLRGDGRIVWCRTQWTAIQVLPARQSRQEWLRSLVKPGNATDLLAGYLPSLMGYGDSPSLPLLVDALYDPDRTVRNFAAAGLLDYYTADDVARALHGREINDSVRELLRYGSR